MHEEKIGLYVLVGAGKVHDLDARRLENVFDQHDHVNALFWRIRRFMQEG